MPRKKPTFIIIFLIILGLSAWGVYVGLQNPATTTQAWHALAEMAPNNNTIQWKYANHLAEQVSFQDDLSKYAKIVSLRKEGYEVDLDEESALAMERVDQMISVYQKVIQADPENAQAYYALGNIYEAVGLLGDAFEQYIASVTAEPSFLDGHYQLGSLYAEIGDVKSSVTAFSQALQLAEQDEEFYMRTISKLFQLGKVHPNEIRYKEAQQKALNKYVSLVNGLAPNAQSYFNLGSLFGEMGEYDRAISAYQMSLDKRPNDDKSLYSLGNIYKDLGQPQEAIALYEKAIKVNATFNDAYLNLGIIYMQSGNFTKAEEVYKRALEANPNNPKLQFNLGYIYEATGEYRKAINNYTNSIKSDPENTKAHYNLGNVYLELQKPQKAISSYLQVVELNPNHQNAWINLTITAFNEKQYQNALRYYDEALLLGYEAAEEFQMAMEKIRTK